MAYRTPILRPAVLVGVDTPAYKAGISALAGSDASCLNQLPTADLPAGYLVMFELAGGGLCSYRLEASTATTAAPGIIRPQDYNSGTPRAWIQVS